MELPKNEIEIKAKVYLSLIVEMEKFLITHGEHSYGPERRMFNERLQIYKTEYFKIINHVQPES